MARLKRAAITAAEDVPREVVPVAEWGGDIELRGLSGRERSAFYAETVDNSGDKPKIKLDNIQARLLVRCIYDEDGKRMFSDAEADVLGAKSGVVLERLFAIAQKLSGLREEDVKELAVNLPATQSAASTSV